MSLQNISHRLGVETDGEAAESCSRKLALVGFGVAHWTEYFMTVRPAVAIKVEGMQFRILLLILEIYE